MISALMPGFVIGAVMALTGAGGGILAVPLLMAVTGIHATEAMPISLLAIGVAAALAAGIGLKRRSVRYRAALWMAGSGMLVAPLGVWLAQRADGRWLGLAFAAILAFVAWRTFTQAGAEDSANSEALVPVRPCVLSDATGRFIWTTRCARVLAAAGGVAGLLSGLLGVGGGFVMVPALKRISDLPMQSVIATSLAVIALVSLSGVVANAAAGNVNWTIALPFALGALAGVASGSLVAARLEGPLLRKGFAVIAALAAAAMATSALLQ